jgi:ribonuclease VapC
LIVVDTSALVAVFLQEENHAVFTDVIDFATEAFISVASRLELVSVLCGRRIEAEADQVADFIDGLHLEHVPVGIDHMRGAIDALLRFGKGRHPARLNFGDCFSYALARELGAGLLYTGEDFAQTDVRPAWRPGKGA